MKSEHYLTKKTASFLQNWMFIINLRWLLFYQFSFHSYWKIKPRTNIAFYSFMLLNLISRRMRRTPLCCETKKTVVVVQRERLVTNYRQQQRQQSALNAARPSAIGGHNPPGQNPPRTPKSRVLAGLSRCALRSNSRALRALWELLWKCQ